MPIKRVEIIDHKDVGEKLIALATGKASLPEEPTREQLEEYFGPSVSIPKHFKVFRIEQATVSANGPSELIIKLPPKKMIEESIKEFSKPDSSYELPSFYADVIFEKKPINITDPEQKLARLAMRVGDYTMGLCK